MYDRHELFAQPDNNDIVWRFMDFTKFVSLLDSRKLFFPRADKLGDPFEGSLPKPNIAARARMLGLVAKEAPDQVKRVDFSKYLESVVRQMCVSVAVSCWHLSPHESAAMWKLYLISSHGVAIRTTYGRLRDSIIDTQRFFLGKVSYIDYETQGISNNLLAPIITKRKSFEHEREVRAVVWDAGAPTTLPISPTIGDGIAMQMDLTTLIDAVYVAPSAPEWFVGVVGSVIAKFGYEFEVKRSCLDDEPLY